MLFSFQHILIFKKPPRVQFKITLSPLLCPIFSHTTPTPSKFSISIIGDSLQGPITNRREHHRRRPKPYFPIDRRTLRWMGVRILISKLKQMIISLQVLPFIRMSLSIYVGTFTQIYYRLFGELS